jgi:hypothetical protein
VKLTIRQTVSRCTGPRARSPQAGDRWGVSRATSGAIRRILNFEKRGTTGCSDTALVTTVSTCGSSPATADIVNDVEPWQCTNALTESAPVVSTTCRIAAGWS